MYSSNVLLWIHKYFEISFFGRPLNKAKIAMARFRIFNGSLKAGQKIYFLATNIETSVLQVGIFNPDFKQQNNLEAGQIGYIITGLKDIEKCRVGDTIALADQEVKSLPGYQEPQSMVFAGLYLKQGGQPQRLR